MTNKTEAIVQDSKITCPTCGSFDNAEVIIGNVMVNSPKLGDILIPGIKHLSCLSCREALRIDHAAAEQIAMFLDASEEKLTGMLPIGDFLSAREASKYLNMEKIPKYRYSVFITYIIDNVTYFYKPSLDAYKINEDGRINLIDELKKVYAKKNIKP